MRLAHANPHLTRKQTRAKPAVIPLAVALMLSGGRIVFPEGHIISRWNLSNRPQVGAFAHGSRWLTFVLLCYMIHGKREKLQQLSKIIFLVRSRTQLEHDGIPNFAT
jgi:hypothetical protein